jgi:hypothetical protein
VRDHFTSDLTEIRPLYLQVEADVGSSLCRLKDSEVGFEGLLVRFVQMLKALVLVGLAL